MSHPDINPDLLPILTEMADGTMLDLPMLTEAINTRIALPAPLLSETQCQQLAEQIFPQLEAVLRGAIGSRSEARWEKAMQQVRSALPELLRDAAKPR